MDLTSLLILIAVWRLLDGCRLCVAAAPDPPHVGTRDGHGRAAALPQSAGDRRVVDRQHVLLCLPTAPMTTFHHFFTIECFLTLTHVSYHRCIRFSHRFSPRVCFVGDDRPVD